MFERFTADAREAVVGAQAQARALSHRYIGTEHLLLALLDPAIGSPYPVLVEAGLGYDRVKADTERILGQGTALGDLDAAALESIGIDLDAVRAKVEETFGPGALDPMPPTRRRGLFRRRMVEPSEPARGHIPFTRRAKKVLELSLREAIALRHNYIGREHIVLALLREGEGLAAQVIHEAGVDFDDLRSRVVTSLKKAA